MVDVLSQPQEGNAGFQSEFRRLAREEAGQAAPPPPADADPPRHETGGQEGDGGQGAEPPQAPAAETPAEGEVVEDPWKDAPPHLRELFESERKGREKAEHAIRTQDGRLSAERRRVLELQARLAGTPPPKTDEEAPATALSEEERKELREEYPGVAAPLLTALEGVEKRLSDLLSRDASRAEIEQAQAQAELHRHYAEQEQAFVEVHPNWKELAGTPEFTRWVEEGPQFIRDALGRNSEFITDAKESIKVIDLYLQETKTEPAPDPLAAKRERQLRGATHIPTRQPAGAREESPNDFKSEWQRLREQERRRAK